MWLRLRQICLAAGELAPVEAALREVFGLEVCHRDPAVAQWGLENAVMPVGDQFLEVVAPVKADAPIRRYLDRRGGGGGYMVITQTDAHAVRKQRAADLGIRIAFEYETDAYHCMQLHPRDTGGAFLEIDWHAGGDDPAGPWTPAGGDWQRARRTDVIAGIRAAELQSPDPERLADRWSEIVEIALTRNDAGQPEIALANAALRFVPCTDGRPEGLGGVDVAVVDRERAMANAKARGASVDGDAILLGGTRFRLVD